MDKIIEVDGNKLTVRLGQYAKSSAEYNPRKEEIMSKIQEQRKIRAEQKVENAATAAIPTNESAHSSSSSTITKSGGRDNR